MFKTRCFSIGIRLAMLVILMMMFLPTNSFAQRRWIVERSPRSRIVVYQPRPYVVYQRRPYYTYRYQSYGYSQPYYANQYTYSWANPTYRYDGYGYRRHQRNRVRIWLR